MATHLVIIVHVYPATKSFHDLLPILGICHDNGFALGIVLLYAHLANCIGTRDTKLLVDLVFNRNAMRVPAEPSHHVVSLHGPVSRNNVFQCPGQKMTIMREACHFG